MDSKYITLFRELAASTAVTAERVLEYNHTKEDEKGEETARIMRDDYQALKDKITEAGDDYVTDRNDAAKLAVASVILAKQLQDKIESLKKALAGYQTDIIPKLQAIVDGSTNDEEARKLANETLIVEEK